MTPARADGFINNGVSLSDERIVALWAQTPEPVTFARAVLAAALEPGRADEHRHGSDAADAARYRELSTPEIHNFIIAVEREALHQRDRWAASGDAGKTDPDWFWLVGYLAGKAISKPDKRLHHIITTAAACLNWHAAAMGVYAQMRPGIVEPSIAQEAPHG